MDPEQGLPSLHDTPSLRYSNWIAAVDDLAATFCTEHYDDGMRSFGITMTDRRWNQLHPGAVQEDGTVNPAQRPPQPQRPTRPVATATHFSNLLSLFNIDNKVYADFRTATEKIKKIYSSQSWLDIIARNSKRK